MSTVDGRHQRGITSRAAILDTAERLFSEAGFHSTSLRTIASTIGMSHAGVLKHFPSKSELLVAILERLEVGNDMVALAPPPDLAPAEVLHMLLEHTMTQTTAMNLRVVLLGEATDAGHPAHAFVRGQLEAVELELGVALGADGVDLLAVWNGLQLIWRYLPDLEPVEIATHYFTASTGPSVDGPSAVTSAALRREPAGEEMPRELQIVAAASDAFARAGYRGTSLRDIAARLGLSHGTVLYHFPTKLDLLTAVLEERDRDESLPWTWDATPLDYLNGMYLQALHNEQHPDLARLFSTLVTEAADPGHPAHAYFRERYMRFHGELRDALTMLAADDLLRDGVDPDSAAYALIAIWEGLGLRGSYLADGTGVPERLLASINSLLAVTLNHASITTG